LATPSTTKDAEPKTLSSWLTGDRPLRAVFSVHRVPLMPLIALFDFGKNILPKVQDCFRKDIVDLKTCVSGEFPVVFGEPAPQGRLVVRL